MTQKPNLRQPVPGMIAPVEQKVLENLSARLELKGDDCLVEFGSFLGKSTASICHGLSNNTSANNHTKIFAYDSFRCHSKGSFLTHLLKHCKQANVEHLIEITGEHFNFFPVFEYYLSEFIDSNLLIPCQSELIDSFPSESNIAFMHIDSPKMYSDFKPILFRFFPKLNKGSYIIFQDFFYHWSSSLIAIIWALVSKDIITPFHVAATSLVCEVKQRPNENEIRDLDRKMKDDNFQLEKLNLAIEAFSAIEFNQKSIFFPRLILARAQFLYERGFHSEAAKTIGKYRQENVQISQDFLSSLEELISYNFSLEKTYQLDHG